MRRIHNLLIILPLLFLQACIPSRENISQMMIGYELKKAGLAIQTLTLDGNAIPYYERKADGPVIVLLHGFSSNKNDWIRFVRYLPKQYRVIVLDLPGHGDNTLKAYKGYDPTALENGVALMVDAIGLDRFHLAGNSLGGLVSKLYAVQHPGKIISLGLFDSAGVTPPERGDFYLAVENGHNPFDVKTKEEYEILKTYAFYDPPFIPWPIEDIVFEHRVRNNDFYLSILKTVSEHPAFIDPDFQEDMLENFSMPVLVLWGDKDRILNVSSTKVYASHIKNLETVILKDCGHVPMIEMPKVSAARYADFIAKH